MVEHAIETLESAELFAGSTEEQEIDLPAPRQEFARIETPTGDLDALLAFQERLSELDGVTKVTVTGSSSGRSTFLVELAQESDAEVRQQIRCSVCDKVIQEGSLPASHGLCDDCRDDYGSSPR